MMIAEDHLKKAMDCLELFRERKDPDHLDKSMIHIKRAYALGDEHIKQVIDPLLKQYDHYRFSEEEGLDGYVYTAGVMINYCMFYMRTRDCLTLHE